MAATRKAHLAKSGTRSVCRHTARPSRRLRVLSLLEFANEPGDSRCSECWDVYRERLSKLEAAIADRAEAA